LRQAGGQATAIGRAAVGAPGALVAAARWYWQRPFVFGWEIICGVTVALMQIPESVAFSFVGEFSPVTGLHSTFFSGLFSSLLGGKPGMVAGLAGALVVVAHEMMASDGPLRSYSRGDRFQHYVLVMALVGVLQCVVAAFGLAKWLRLVPRPVHVGFLNGLAVVIFMTQLAEFKVCQAPVQVPFGECPSHHRVFMSPRDGSTWIAVLYACVSAGIVLAVPKIPNVGPYVPSPLLALLLCSAVEWGVVRRFSSLRARTVGETATVAGAWPTWSPPQTPAAGWHWPTVVQYAALLTLVAVLESLLSVAALNTATQTNTTLPQLSQQAAAEGVGNVCASLFGTVGGAVMIGTSTVNIMSGARGRLSSFTAAVFVLTVVLVASPAIGLIPTPALAGIMFVVVLRTFEWSTFKAFLRAPLPDSFLVVLTTVLAVVTDIAIAVLVGTSVAALMHAWADSGTLTVTRSSPVDEEAGPGAGEDTTAAAAASGYAVHGGRLSFATSWAFEVQLTAIARAPAHVVTLDFSGSGITDYSGVHALYRAAKLFRRAGKVLQVRHMDHGSAVLLARAGRMSRSAAIPVVHLRPLDDSSVSMAAAIGSLQAPAAVQAVVETEDVESRAAFREDAPSPATVEGAAAEEAALQISLEGSDESPRAVGRQ